MATTSAKSWSSHRHVRRSLTIPSPFKHLVAFGESYEQRVGRVVVHGEGDDVGSVAATGTWLTPFVGDINADVAVSRRPLELELLRTDALRKSHRALDAALVSGGMRLFVRRGGGGFELFVMQGSATSEEVDAAVAALVTNANARDCLGWCVRRLSGAASGNVTFYARVPMLAPMFDHWSDSSNDVSTVIDMEVSGNFLASRAAMTVKRFHRHAFFNVLSASPGRGVVLDAIPSIHRERIRRQLERSDRFTGPHAAPRDGHADEQSVVVVSDADGVQPPESVEEFRVASPCLFVCSQGDAHEAVLSIVHQVIASLPDDEWPAVRFGNEIWLSGALRLRNGPTSPAVPRGVLFVDARQAGRDDLVPVIAEMSKPKEKRVCILFDGSAVTADEIVSILRARPRAFISVFRLAPQLVANVRARVGDDVMNERVIDMSNIAFVFNAMHGKLEMSAERRAVLRRFFAFVTAAREVSSEFHQMADDDTSFAFYERD